jgi:hypothetical protein
MWGEGLEEYLRFLAGWIVAAAIGAVGVAGLFGLHWLATNFGRSLDQPHYLYLIGTVAGFALWGGLMVKFEKPRY